MLLLGFRWTQIFFICTDNRLLADALCTAVITDQSGVEAMLWICIGLFLGSSPSRASGCPEFDFSWLFKILQLFNYGMMSQLSHDRLLPDTMQCIVRVLSCNGRRALRDADSAAESTRETSFCKS
jgi:hypothetical protein